jgi:alpha-ketoglutarate-dependent taurine dioxygenase
MSVAEQSRLKAEPIKPSIGSRILADKATLLGGEHADELRDLLEQRGVLVFPQIHFTDEEQLAFTRTLGTLAREVRDNAEVYKVTMDSSVTPTAEYLKGAFYWHFDGSMSPMPILASILSAKVLSEEGGDTDFCNTYAAYEALSDAEKAELEGLTAMHTNASAQLYVHPEPTLEQWREWRSIGIGGKELPLVWTHRSGRRSLVIGNTAHHVVGMDPLDGRELLIRLRDWATRPEFSYRHRWTIGDAVMWDNTGTLHRATPYPLDSGRCLHRTKLEGEEAIAA